LQGLEASILVGIVMCALHFAYEYSVMQLVSFTVASSRSNNLLPYRYQQVLAIFRGNMLAVSVSGAPPSVSCQLHDYSRRWSCLEFRSIDVGPSGLRCKRSSRGLRTGMLLFVASSRLMCARRLHLLRLNG
jgi:hypothetical protein